MTTARRSIDRVELIAVAHVFATARVRTKIASDCEVVVEQLLDTLHGANMNDRNGNEDLWEVIDAAINVNPQGFFDIRWVKAHLPIEKAREIEHQTGIPAKYIQGNNHADDHAKLAMRLHRHDAARFAEADYRIALACLVQSINANIWTKTLEADPKFAEYQEEEAPEDLERCYDT